jgi:hypothetical protein
VALIRTDVSEDPISLCTCSHSFTLKMEAIRSSETSVLVRATRCHLPEDDNHQYFLVISRRISLVLGDQIAVVNLTEIVQ